MLLPALAGAAAIQVSQGPRNSGGASLSSDGQRLVFYSANDLDGSNADGSFDVFAYQRSSDQTQALSSFAGGALAGGHQTPVISGDGSTVVYQRFESQPNGTVLFGSLAGSFAGGAATALTGLGGFQTGDISDDGRQVLLDISNVGLVLLDLQAGTQQLVAGGNGLAFGLSGDGKRLVRQSFGGAISVVDVDSGTVQAISAATAGGAFFDAAISGDGRHVAFTTSLNPLGSNADGNVEAFVIDLDSGLLRQITHSTDSRTLRGLALSDDGSRLVFSSQRDLAGGNADHGEEVFLADLLAGSLGQITSHADAAVQSLEATISGDGLTAAWTTFGAGGGSQIFLSDLAPRAQDVPEPGSLALLLLAAGAAWQARRRPAPQA